MCDTSQQPALGYMEIVNDRTAATLLPIIEDHTHNGTIIWSDSWAAYNNIQQLPTVQNHDTVNHSLEFVDCQTGVHTNHIESYWNRVKIKLKRMRGCHRTMLASYLDEFLWRERYGRTSSDVLENMYIQRYSHLVSCLSFPHSIFFNSSFQSYKNQFFSELPFCKRSTFNGLVPHPYLSTFETS